MEVGYLMTSKDESYHNMHSRTKVFVERSTRYLLFRVQQDDPKTGESRYETPRAGHVGFWLLRIQQYTDEKGPIPIRTMKEYKQALHWILECRVDGKLPNELPHMKYTSSKEFKKKLKDWQPKRTAATATENGASGVSQLQQCNTLAGAPVLRSTSGPLSRRNHNLSVSLMPKNDVRYLLTYIRQRRSSTTTSGEVRTSKIGTRSCMPSRRSSASVFQWTDSHGRAKSVIST